MRWLLVKDLRILQRSPLLVGLLVVYPVVIAVLIGFALSRGPDKPEVAFYNGLSEGAVVELGGEEIDLTREGSRLFDEIDAVPVDSREEAIQKVRDGDVLGALIIPDDLASNLQSTLEPGTVEVFYNAEDPAKKEFVENTIEAQVQRANAALTKRIAEEALDLLNLISDGGDYSFLGQDFDVLGLARAERILTEARKELPPGSAEARAARRGHLLRRAGAGEPGLLRRGAGRGGRADQGRRARARGREHVAERVCRRARGGGHAHVHHGAAGRGDAGGRARGERLREARARARVAHRPARREGRPGGGLLERGLPADARRPRPVHRPELGSLSALARGRRRRERWPSPRWAWRSGRSRARCGPPR